MIGGSAGVVRLRITNTGDSRFTGPVSITLYAANNDSTDSTSLASDAAATTATFSNISLGANRSRVVSLKFHYPSSLADGSYFLISSLDEMGLNTADSVTTAPSTLRIDAPTVDLAATFAASQPVRVRQDKNNSVVIVLRNTGNVTATGTVNLSLYASSNATLDTATDVLLTGLSGRSIHLKPGQSTRIRLTFQSPSGVTFGNNYLIASTTSATEPADTNAANDIAVIATTN